MQLCNLCAAIHKKGTFYPVMTEVHTLTDTFFKKNILFYAMTEMQTLTDTLKKGAKLTYNSSRLTCGQKQF